MDPLLELLKGNSKPKPRLEHRSHAAVVFTCMDARIDPLEIFSREAGELYCVRTAGHVLGPQVVGSLEMGLAAGCPLILVLGHTDCTAVDLARRGAGGNDSVIRHIRQAMHSLREGASGDEVAEANVRFTVAELRSRLKGRVEGAMLDLSTGLVRELSC